MEIIIYIIIAIVVLLYVLDWFDERKRRHIMQRHIEEIRNKICGTPNT